MTAIRKVGHDLKFDAIVLARHGVTLRGFDTDVMIASYLVDANVAHPLEDLAIEHIGYKALSEEDVCGRGVKAVTFADIPVDRALAYAGERADLALQLAATLPEELRKNDLQRVYDELEAAAHPRARRHRARRRTHRHGRARRAGDAARSGALAAGGTRLRARGRRVQHQLAQEAVGDPLRPPGHAHRDDPPDDEDQGPVNGVRSARRACADARTAQAHPRVAQPPEAEGHVHRCAAHAREPQHGPRAYVLQPGGGGDRAAEQQRSQPAEHPDPDRHRPGDPARLRGRTWPRADLGRLLADRAARPRAPGGGADARRGVPQRRGYSRSDGTQGIRTRERPWRRTSCAGARRSSTTRCSTANRRLRSPRTSASPGRKRRSSSTPTSPASRRSGRSSTASSSARAKPASSRRCSAGGGSCPTSTPATSRCAARPSARR